MAIGFLLTMWLGNAIADPLLVALAGGDDLHSNDFRLLVVVESSDRFLDVCVLLPCRFDVAYPLSRRLGFTLPCV